MGFEYIFFDASLADALASFAAGLGVSAQVRADALGGWVVQVPEDMPAGAEDAIETEYDRLMLRQRDVLDAADGADANDVLGVQVTLPGGESCLVRVPPHLGRRLVDQFSFEEIHQLVTLIAAQALQPADGPLCRKL
ncbi:hypothetical protein [Rhodoferax sp.]|uniref:hypothetical protein n=1 Tax=Rhodoferax sp. TaxID=50421 RepID=UPI00284A72B4|nr:hypothetical protein [Rhodoferax sp.]MDR3369834.1 hypothetical protein [Rhodoferax sp.]